MLFSSFSLNGIFALPRLEHNLKNASEAVCSVPTNKKISLYIHIPFCSSSCDFCHLRLGGNVVKDVSDSYIEILQKEIKLCSDHIKDTNIDSIYFGGGTPSLLKPTQIDRIIDSVGKYFSIANNTDISIEGTPNTLANPELLHCLKKNGIRRASFGVQVFDKQLRKILGRKGNLKENYVAVDLLNKYCMEDINIDYIYNLPGNDNQFTDLELSEIERLSPSSIDFHPLKYTSCNNKMIKRIIRSKLRIPTSTDRINQFRRIRSWMLLNGYKESYLGVYNKTEHHNKYLDRLHGLRGGQYYGIGLGARSFIGDFSFSNTQNLIEYEENINRGERPIARTASVTQSDNYIALFPKRNDLLLEEDVELTSDKTYYESILNALEGHNLISIDDKGCRLSAKGIPWYQNIQEILLSKSQKMIHQKSSENRFSILENYKEHFDNLYY